MNNPRTFVLGIDGVPYTFLKDVFNKGWMPALSKLSQEHGPKRMNSVYPTVSSVAWTTYSTGKNPAEHGIFGFMDRSPSPFNLKIPTAIDRKAETIWHKLSSEGKRVIVINVPLTYPPEEVNGILVSGFLCTDIDKSSYPETFNNFLKSKGYIIDPDAWLARESKKKFMKQLQKAMVKRFEITFELIDKEMWDYFQLHVMETDRLFHFFWDDLENEGDFYLDIKSLFNKLDDLIAQLHKRLSEDDRLLILSDHGFCGIEADVQLNTWLEEEGLLKFESSLAEKTLVNYYKDSLCYSLIPGRIYVNLKGREEKGTVRKEDYDKIREEIKQRLLEFKDPDTHNKVIDRVFFREEIYNGPYLENAADIIAHPVKGYDLKARVGINDIFVRSDINGMHTYDDAFICGVNLDTSSVKSIQDVRFKCLGI